VGVGDTPEMFDEEVPASSGRGGKGRKRAKASAKKRLAAASTASPESDVSIAVEDDTGGDDNYPKDRRASRERSLHRLLAGLRAVNAGDFSTRLTPNGDPLMADIIDVFNAVTQKQARLSEEITRVSTSVGREGKMRDRVRFDLHYMQQWSFALDLRIVALRRLGCRDV